MLKNIFAAIGALYVGQKGYAFYREYTELKQAQRFWQAQNKPASQQAEQE